MPVSRQHPSKKSPNQSPVAFFEGKQAGGADGKGSYKAPDKLSSGTQREKIYGRKDLGK